MADIRSYMKEKAKREQKQAGYREKIARHKLASIYRILLVAAALAAVAAIVVVQYRKHIYTEYDTISSVERETAGGAVDVKLGSTVLTYSKDGAHCTDAKGNVRWNQTFEMQDARLSISGDTVAIGDYNGRSIYVANSEEILGEITTTRPIRAIAASAGGYVAAVLADTDVTWINIYRYDGRMVYEGQAHMDDSGYPLALGLSPGGELLGVVYAHVDAGTLKTTVAFYNLGEVGDNVSDNFVSFWSYSDMLIPYIQFMNDNTSFAVGDGMLIVYSGNHKPVPMAGDLYSREVQSVHFSDRYVGLVYVSDNSEHRYQLVVYDTADHSADSVMDKKSFYFDIEYKDIFFGKGNFVVYNEKECQIITLDGTEKFHGDFLKNVRLMLPVGNAYRYQLVTENSIDTIQLK